MRKCTRPLALIVVAMYLAAVGCGVGVAEKSSAPGASAQTDDIIGGGPPTIDSPSVAADALDLGDSATIGVDMMTSIEADLAERIERQSYGRVSITRMGPSRFAAMTDAQFLDYQNQLGRQLEAILSDNSAAAQQIVDDFHEEWQEHPCPSNEPVDDALFGSHGSTDLTVFHVADLWLPHGVLLESNDNFVGESGVATKIGQAGFYRFYVASNERPGLPAFAQLVAPGANVPDRWILDERFELYSEFGTMWLGSPDSPPLKRFARDPIESIAAQILYEEFVDNSSDCIHWQRDDGLNFLEQSIGFGAFDSYVGYDESNQIVAITWDLARTPWSSAGLPGQAPTRSDIQR